MRTLALIALSLASHLALAHPTTASITVPMHLLNPQQTPIGTITARQTSRGLQFTPQLHDLPPGPHGFHVHIKPSCANHGVAAAGHFDPKHTDKHLGPYRNGHLGDLPRLIVNKQGKANQAVVAPHLKLNDLKGHSLMIHQGGDNYSDQPKPLGGGGKRIACGVIK